MRILLGRDATDIRIAIEELHFTDDDIFNAENGLKIAVAFTSYNNEREYELPKEYGELILNSKAWGFRENGDVFSERKPL